MKVKIVDEQDWRTFVDNCECATFFHTCDWYQVWNRYQGYEYRAYLFEFDTGHKVLLPLASRRVFRGIFKGYFSSPAGTYGGFLTDDPLADQEIFVLSKWVKRFHRLDLAYNPFSSISWILPTSRKDFTQVILLTEDWPSIERKMKKGNITRKVRMAERYHLILRKMEIDEIGLFYEIYLSRRSAWSKPTNEYDLTLFEYLFQLEKIDFWGVYLSEGTLIGGGIFVRHNGHISSWLPSILTKYLPMKPYEFLFYNLIKFYKEQRFQWFDFNPSGGHEGVVRFKAGFGAKKKYFSIFKHSSDTAKTLLKTYNILRRIRDW